MKDLGNDDLLREICAAAAFVAAETDYSRDLLRQRCPDSAAKIHRVYNGMDLTRFPVPASTAKIQAQKLPRIISVGRLVAFKGFEDLIDACAELARQGLEFTCEIIGDGPLRETLQARLKSWTCQARFISSAHCRKERSWKNSGLLIFSRLLRPQTRKEPAMFFQR